MFALAGEPVVVRERRRVHEHPALLRDAGGLRRLRAAKDQRSALIDLDVGVHQLRVRSGDPAIRWRTAYRWWPRPGRRGSRRRGCRRPRWRSVPRGLRCARGGRSRLRPAVLRTACSNAAYQMTGAMKSSSELGRVVRVTVAAQRCGRARCRRAGRATRAGARTRGLHERVAGLAAGEQGYVQVTVRDVGGEPAEQDDRAGSAARGRECLARGDAELGGQQRSRGPGPARRTGRRRRPPARGSEDRRSHVSASAALAAAAMSPSGDASPSSAGRWTIWPAPTRTGVRGSIGMGLA